MKQWARVLVGMAALLLWASGATVFAAGYGAAGCGPGSVVANPKNETGHQAYAAMINMSAGSNLYVISIPTVQQSAITSGTSNCGNSAKIKNYAAQDAFAQSTYQELAKEMAAGDGETVRTLAALMGCPKEQEAGFARFVKNSYPSIFPSDQVPSADMLQQLKAEMSRDPELAGACRSL